MGDAFAFGCRERDCLGCCSNCCSSTCCCCTKNNVSTLEINMDTTRKHQNHQIKFRSTATSKFRGEYALKVSTIDSDNDNDTDPSDPSTSTSDETDTYQPHTSYTEPVTTEIQSDNKEESAVETDKYEPTNGANSQTDSDEMDAEVEMSDNANTYDTKIDKNEEQNTESNQNKLELLDNLNKYDITIEQNNIETKSSESDNKEEHSDNSGSDRQVSHLAIVNPETDMNSIVINIAMEEEESERKSEDSPVAIAKKHLLLNNYKSVDQMLDDESIDSLVAMKFNERVSKVLGDQKQYDIPSKSEESQRFHLERDLRKIKFALKDLRVSEQRKYAKNSILKHIPLLTAVYMRYCKIGGDRHWLTYDGWVSLLRDSHIISMGDENEAYFSIFHQIYAYHQVKTHKKKARLRGHSTQLSGLYGTKSFHGDKDPWTGVWCMQKDKQRIHRIEKKQRATEERERELRKNSKYVKKKQPKLSIKQKSQEYYDKYKLRKIGDLRVIGCMNNSEYADIAGTFNKSNYKKAKLEIRFKKRRIKVHNQKRIWNCQIIPPKHFVDPITMKVKWSEINEKSSKIKDGTFKLYKHQSLSDDDEDLPISQYVGLARFEFLDAMLELSVMLNENINSSDTIANAGSKDMYQCFDELCNGYLSEYIYKNHLELEKHMKGKTINENVRLKLKAYNTILMKLFKKYASLDNDEISTKYEQHLDSDEWCAIAVDLCKAAKTFEKQIWKLGGKPSMNEMFQCFILSKNDTLLMDEEIGFKEFQRALILFTNQIFKYEPKTRYEAIDFDKKLDLVLSWCEKLEAQTVSISSKSYHRSETLTRLKRQRSIHQNSQSGHSQSGHSQRPKSPSPVPRPDWTSY